MAEIERGMTGRARGERQAVVDRREAIAKALELVVIEEQFRSAKMTRPNIGVGAWALPNLIVHGTEDQVLPVHNGRLIASRIPGSRLEILPGVGHLFFFERPEQSAELMRAHAGLLGSRS